MNIRTKLIVMLAVPLLALAVVAAVGIRSQNTQGEINEDALESVETIANLDELWTRIADERLAVLSAEEGENADLTELIEATNATKDRIERAGDDRGWTVAALAAEALPEDRGQASTTAFAAYSDALDVLEEGIADQALTGLDADAVLTAVAMTDARDASRLQEESWLQLLIVDNLNPGTVRSLVSDFGSAETAREQAASITLTDGTQPFFDPVFSARRTQLTRIETLVLAQLDDATGTDLGPDFIDNAVASLPSVDLIESLNLNRAEWNEASFAAQDVLRADVDENFAEIEQAQSLSLFLALLGGFLLFTLIFVIGRSIVGPLSRLMENAGVMTNERLPAAVAQLRTIGASDEVPELAPIPKEADDEIGTIVEAFNEMQSSALKVATDQARSRRNVAEMFVSLGRRNQQLNHRMITMISDLERDEQDPDTLRGLYQLDHLATRMRRNAESLLVLAGNRSPRQWKRPVAFDDVVRSSLAEVEYFERVEIGNLPELDMSGAVVTDITHMLAELLDNATQFSDPATTVALSAVETHTAVELQIQDNGFGINPEDLAVLNERVTNPPELDQAPSRLLGLFVVGRLAQQHNVHVGLQSVPGEGTVVTVTIPKAHFPVEVAENPIQVPVTPAASAPVEVNADNAADFFSTGQSTDAASELPVPDAVSELPVPDAAPEPVVAEAEQEYVEQFELDEVAEAPVVEAEIEEPVINEVPEVEVPVAEVPEVEAPVAEVPEVEAPVVEAAIEEPVIDEAPAVAAVDTVAEAPVVDDSDLSLTEESWPLTKLTPPPEREVSAMEAVQRTAEESAPVEAPIEDIAAAPAMPAPIVEEPSVDPMPEAPVMPTPPVVAEAPAAPEAVAEVITAAPEPEAPTSTFGGLPTRMPQATIEEVETEPAVLPLALPDEEPAEETKTSSISFGHFAKGIAAGLDEVNEGENS